ncbi:LysR family transcriptional regulator [Bacillus cereus]|uniref:LysR family transcriptional regulator n=1 Tax=Bacillus cereus TaxID=1396 RepID=UPI000BF5FD6E|nr:LysR family transcriptional regulator [Bacillus cereus]MEB9822069.1 LysR family transcriptional regulator [Bacillus cereus]MEB9828494.1 LysR family transcriptional regulator [Bacillus cereus]PES03472.1 LysR family transcriptional regulator [Bacillus cereus]PFF74032.1 LysR family transcriptional regulator [Bacillus cereus]
MEVKELITFKKIIEEGTFSLAAKKLNCAQSTVTTHIKKLENDLGFFLFERGWEARLTEEGLLFSKEVDNLLLHWDYSISQAQRISKEEKGNLKIGLLESVAKELIPTILKYLNENKPYINCDFTIGNTTLLTKLIDQNKIDFAVCEGKENISNVNFNPIYREQVNFIVNNPKHPILQKESVEISDVINYPILIGETSCYYYKSVNNFLTENNLSFKRVYNCSALHLIPQMIFGNAVGIIPKGITLNQNSISFHVKEFDPTLSIGLLISSKKKNYLSQTKQCIMKLIESSLL